MTQPLPIETGEIELSDLDRQFGALMMRLSGSSDPTIGLAASLASHATSNGDVCGRLDEYAESLTSATLISLSATAPEAALENWVESLRNSGVVGEPGA